MEKGCRSAAKVLTTWKTLKANRVSLSCLISVIWGLFREKKIRLFFPASFSIPCLRNSECVYQQVICWSNWPSFPVISCCTLCPLVHLGNVFSIQPLLFLKRWYSDMHLLRKHESSSDPGLWEKNKSLCLFLVWDELYLYLRSAITFAGKSHLACHNDTQDIATHTLATTLAWP